MKKSMIKRVLSLFAAAAVAVSMAGCRSADSVYEIKSIEPPKDGWRVEQLNDVLYLNGRKIELPLMLSSLGEDYEIREKRYNDESSLDKDIVGGYLYCNDEVIALVTFLEQGEDAEFLRLYFFRDLYSENQDVKEYITINGFGLESDIAKVTDYLGNGYLNESELLKYYVEDGEYLITIPNTDEFWISLESTGAEKNEALSESQQQAK